MKKISISTLISGLILLAIGSFNFFEKYNNYLIEEEKNANITVEGKYINNSDMIVVTASNDEFLSVAINDETFDFEHDGDYYKNNVLNYLIKFQNDNLIIVKKGEESILFTKIK
ncbi:MAG: hypothetical protein IJ568_04160 [Bacilli bacterium]|nr:hypothetical protein [Bacilli bacterium]